MAPSMVKIEPYFLPPRDTCCIDMLSKNTGNVCWRQLERLDSPDLNHGSVIHQPCGLRQVTDNLHASVLPAYKIEIMA